MTSTYFIAFDGFDNTICHGNRSDCERAAQQWANANGETAYVSTSNRGEPDDDGEYPEVEVHELHPE